MCLSWLLTVHAHTKIRQRIRLPYAVFYDHRGPTPSPNLENQAKSQHLFIFYQTIWPLKCRQGTKNGVWVRISPKKQGFGGEHVSHATNKKFKITNPKNAIHFWTSFCRFSKIHVGSGVFLANVKNAQKVVQFFSWPWSRFRQVDRVSYNMCIYHGARRRRAAGMP